MKTPSAHCRMLICLAVVLCASGLALGQEIIAPATQPASQPASQPATEPAVAETLHSLAKQSMVVVRYSFKKDPASEGENADRQDEWVEFFNRLVDRKMTLDTAGVVIAPGQVLVPDLRLEERIVAGITVQTLNGQSFPARLGWLLLNSDAAVLKVEGGADILKPVEFQPLADLTAQTKLHRVWLARTEAGCRIEQAEISPSVLLGEDARQTNFTFGLLGARGYRSYPDEDVSGPAIFADSEGRPVGVSCAPGLDAQELHGAWRGASVLNGPRVEVARLDEQRNAMRQKLLSAVHELAIQFRQGGEEAAPGRPGGSPSLGGEPVAGREVTVFGLAISPTQLLVPAMLDRKQAAQIDRIDVKDAQGKRLPARFVGAYKDFGAFIVELRDARLPAAAELSDDLPARSQMFWEATMGKKFAGKWVRLDYNRLVGRDRGYANQFSWVAQRAIPPTSLLVDFHGRVFGLALRQRIEDQERIQAAQGTGGRYSGSREDDNRVFTVAELRTALADFEGHFDPKVVVKGRLEARRRPWFGVEFVTLSADVAEQMKISKPTKDGSVGLLINAVYAGSPAAAAGVQVGDILLSLAVDGKADAPVEFKRDSVGDDDESSRWRYMYGYGSRGDDGESVAGEEGPAEATWKSRGNYLTNLLDAVGVGQKVTIRYYRPVQAEGAEKEAKFQISLAPPDQDSARRWRNRKLGLTVKDLTYEVRQALSLQADAPGAVVARIEPGSPASIARVWPNEIVTHADGKPVAGAWELQKAIAAAKAAGADKVRLTVLRLGKSRFADLKVEAYAANDDEGLDE